MSLNKSSVKKVWASVIWTYEKKTKIIKIINSWTTGVTLEDELLFCLLFFSTNNCLDLHLTANETDNSKTLLVSESKATMKLDMVWWIPYLTSLRSKRFRKVFRTFEAFFVF